MPGVFDHLTRRHQVNLLEEVRSGGFPNSTRALERTGTTFYCTIVPLAGNDQVILSQLGSRLVLKVIMAEQHSFDSAKSYLEGLSPDYEDKVIKVSSPIGTHRGLDGSTLYWCLAEIRSEDQQLPITGP